MLGKLKHRTISEKKQSTIVRCLHTHQVDFFSKLGSTNVRDIQSLRTHLAAAHANTIDASASLTVSAASPFTALLTKLPGTMAPHPDTGIYSKTSPDQDPTTMASCAATPETPVTGAPVVRTSLITEAIAIRDMAAPFPPEVSVSVTHSRAPGMVSQIGMVT
jgi:hypothetical protein